MVPISEISGVGPKITVVLKTLTRSVAGSERYEVGLKNRWDLVGGRPYLHTLYK